MGRQGIIPDAYFQIKRQVEGQEKMAAFFLELERVAKTSKVVKSKLQRYGQMYYGGTYERLFGTRALRVLFVFASGDDGGSARLVEGACQEAQRTGVTIARFSQMHRLTCSTPTGCLREPLWLEPGQ